MGFFDKLKKGSQPPRWEELEEAVAAIQAAVRAGATGHELTDVINNLMQVKKANPGSENLMLGLLAPVLVEDNHAGAGLIAVLCGAHIEDGADATIIVSNLIEGYKKALRPAKEFVQACIAQDLPEEVYAELQDENGNVDPTDIVHKHMEFFGRQLLQNNPKWANAWESLEYFGMAGNAVFSSSAQARALGAADVELTDLLSFHEDIAPNAIYSYKLITMLNEEIVVLHRETTQGFRVRISGIEVNFQLHTLLGAAVNGEGKFPYPAPSADEVAAAKREVYHEQGSLFQGLFNMVNWTGYAPNLVHPEIDAEENPGLAMGQHWIWNEGTPADIIPFQGTRVVVIEEAPYNRTWTSGTSFPGLAVECEVVGRLTPAEVEEWFVKFAQATEV